MSNTQEYNENAIKSYENFAEDFFNNFDKYKKIYNPKTFFLDTSFEILRKRNALDNYILKYYSKLNLKNPVDLAIKRNMDKYLQRFFKTFMSNPSELLESPFLSMIDTLCPEIIKVNGQNIDLRKKVESEYNRNKITFEKSEQLYIKDRNLDSLSEEETNQLMHFFISNIGTTNRTIKKYQENYIKKLISQNKKVSILSIKQIEFIAKYMNNLMLNSRLNQLGYNRNDIKSYIYIGTALKNHGGFETYNNIYINKNSVLTSDIPHLMQVVCHETEHSIQELQAQKNPQSKIGLDCAISNILRNYYSSIRNYDVYHENYNFEQIEQDSENIGYSYAINYLDTLGFKDKATKLKTEKEKRFNNRQFEYDFRKDENQKKSTREVFFFESLNSAISRFPGYLQQYPVLLNLYNQDGHVKSFEDLITSNFKLDDQSKCDILEDFCKYYISQGKLDDLDLNNFPAEIQANIASRLIDLLAREKSQIESMGNEKGKSSSQSISQEDKTHVEIFHLKNSKNIMQFINKNYQHFMELQDKGAFSSIIDMSYYDTYTRAFKQDNLYENLAYKNPQNITKLKQLAIEAEKNRNAYRNRKKIFSPNTLEDSFNELLSDSKLNEFQDATHFLSTLSHENTLNPNQDMEEK